MASTLEHRGSYPYSIARAHYDRERCPNSENPSFKPDGHFCAWRKHAPLLFQKVSQFVGAKAL